MATQNTDSVRTAIGAGSLGFGVLATLSPRVLRRAYGDPASSGGALDYFGRTWGTRTAVLGALTLMASSDEEVGAAGGAGRGHERRRLVGGVQRSVACPAGPG